MTQGLRTLSKDNELVEQKRRIIMEAAVKVFDKKSFAEATIQEIADIAGMAPGNIYRYIGSKQDILHLICNKARESGEYLNGLFESLNSMNPTESLIHCIRAEMKDVDDEEWINRNIFYIREIRNFSREDQTFLLEASEEYIRFFEQLIKEGVRKGVFKTENPLLVAHNIARLPHGWLLTRWFLRKHFTGEEYTELQIKEILKSLSVREKEIEKIQILAES